MTQIQILSIGKATPEYSSLMAHWLKMTKLSISEKVLIAPKGLKGESHKAEEAKMLGKYITRPGVLIALDAQGRSMPSDKFAEMLQRNMDNAKPMTFMIGGAYGLDSSIINEADLMLSLSAMTMPHLLAKLILIEQIYRAETINLGHPYHK
ncbi:MAG: 23S rRNA (pseudouridine(1915)-N(3))-methyltransferase RlmH [Pseudomonadota bacterium]